MNERRKKLLNHFYQSSFMGRYRWTAELAVQLREEDSALFFEGMEDAILNYITEWMAGRSLRLGDLRTSAEALPVPEAEAYEERV